MPRTSEIAGAATANGAAASRDQAKSADLNGGESSELRELLHALQAMRVGDFSVRMAGDQVGLMGKVADTFNEIVAANQRMARQLERVGQVVGRDGKTRQRVRFGLSEGAWGEMESSVNQLIDDLLWPTTEVTRAIAAVAQGDLLRTVALDVDGRPLKGEFLRSAEIVNTMIKQFNVFTSEVTRVAREVGTEGKLGGQAQVGGVTGVWKDLTESVNSMASNLTAQVRNIAEVTIAVANGDLSKKITVDVRGEILQLKEAINTMVDQLNAFAGEVTRVAREVGTEGRLGGQANVLGVAGTWKDLTDSVNSMASNLTVQVRNIAEVSTAIASGDLSKKITVDVRGEILELKDTINTMVDQLNVFAGEVTRVAREVGTEGKLGGQAMVRGVAGTWKDLTDSVNSTASNLTGQVRNIAEVATAVARGDLSKKITVNVSGEILQLKETLNTMVDQLNAFAAEVTRVAREVGTEGKLGGQAQVPGVAGTWKDLTDSVNSMAGNLTAQVRNIAEVATAIAGGDLSRKITVDVRGEILQLKETLNTMVDQLNRFAGEVTRVAREVGTEGKLGGQAQVPGVAGTWKDLTDSVNSMAGNLTAQVRNIAEVTTAVARGDLSRKITVDVRGEILELKNTINTMADQLNAFASDDVYRLRGYEMGAVDYVPVPVVPAVLRAKVKVFAELYRKTRELERLNAELERRVADRTAELETSNLRLLESEQSRSLALAAGRMGSWDWDLVTGELKWDEGQRHVFGVDRDSFKPTIDNIRAVVHPEDWARLQDIGRRIAEGTRTLQTDFRVIQPDGKMRWCTGTAAASFDAANNVVRVSGVTIDVTERKEAEERQDLLAREVDHRARNVLAVVQSIVRLTRASNIENYVGAVEGRIKALARAHALLSDSRWHSADLGTLVAEELAPYRAGDGAKVKIGGPNISLQPHMAQGLALAVHELATNAAKHGALSSMAGKLSVSWQLMPDCLILRWVEAGGQPIVRPSARSFGLKVIRASIESQLGGKALFDWDPRGMRCTLSIPQRKTASAREPLKPAYGDAGAPTPLSSTGARKVLLVEDEALVAMMIQEFLTESGHSVIGPISRAAEALRAAKEADVDTAILDINLGDGMAYPVADALSARGIPFVFVTGYDADTIDERFSNTPVLQKPVERQMLQRIFLPEAGLAPIVRGNGAAAAGARS